MVFVWAPTVTIFGVSRDMQECTLTYVVVTFGTHYDKLGTPSLLSYCLYHRISITVCTNIVLGVSRLECVWFVICGQVEGVEYLTIPLDSPTLKDFLEQQDEES